MINQIWSGRSLLHIIMLPLSWLYGLVSTLIRLSYFCGLRKSWRAPVPVVIVGNLTAGGSGKTPIVIWLVNQLQQRGYRAGVVARGYGGKSRLLVLTQHSTPDEAGDEPLLIYRRTGAPIAIAPKRSDAIRALLKKHPVDLVIADDGLQHYGLKRDFELAVIDGTRRFGNGCWLPAGPMRERENRLKSVDACIVNGGVPHAGEIPMSLRVGEAVHILSGKRCSVTYLTHVVAVAGIGHPQRFFSMLKELGVDVEKEVAFSDHKKYRPGSLLALTRGKQILLMTEKDAVKCYNFARPNWWYLIVDAVLPYREAQKLIKKIECLIS